MITLNDVQLLTMATANDLHMSLPTYDEETNILENDSFSLTVISLDETHVSLCGIIHGVDYGAILIDRERNRYAVIDGDRWILGSPTGEVWANCPIHANSDVSIYSYLEDQGPKEIIDYLAKDTEAVIVCPPRKVLNALNS